MGQQISSIPSLKEIQDFQVNRIGQFEAIRQSLYDFQTYPNAGSTTLTFFQLPIGQGGKTRADTNLTLAGTIAAPINFFVQSIEVVFLPGVLPGTVAAAAPVSNFANDVYTVAKSGWLDFFIGSKSYLQEAPLGRFPPKTRLDGWAAAALVDSDLAAGARFAIDYAAMAGRPYFIDPGILLAPTQNFNVTLNFPAAVPLPSAADGRIGVILDGILYRLSQ